MKSFLRIVFAAAVFTVSSHADVIVNTFGPDYGVGDSTAVIQQVPHYEALAVAFTPATAVNLSQMDFGFFAYGAANNIEIDLTNDDSGSPGSVIHSWDLQLAGFQQYLSTVPTNATLAGNTQYWTISALDQQTDVGWFVSPLDIQRTIGVNLGQGWIVFTDTPFAFDVIGTPAVPEPGTLCLLGTAGMGVAFLRRRIK